MYCELKTSRLNIRPINLVDSKFMLELVNTKGWMKYIGDRKVHTITDAEQYIQRILDNPLYFYHVIEVSNSNEPVGVISFLKRDSQQYYDIGFAMLPNFERRGIAFEACTAYMHAIQADQAFENLIAICLPSNEPSIELLKKLGFTYQNDFQQGEDVLSLYALKEQMKGFD